jgi:hypothetical protein
MKSIMHDKYLVFMLSALMSFSVCAADPASDLAGVATPTDGYIKSVQFIISIYRENGHTKKTGSVSHATNTETMRVGDGQAAFIGSSKEIPIPTVTAAKADNNASAKPVEYKKLESGVELRPHLMGRYVQLEIVEKDETWNDETKAIDTNNIHSVVTLPLDQWSKVKGTLNDNEDIEDIYKPNREKGEELWVKIELAPN